MAAPNQLGMSVAVLLAWLVLSDAEISTEELDTLRQLGGTGPQAPNVDALMELVKSARVEDLQLACEVMRHLPTDGRLRFMEMATAIAIADGVLRPAENHILRFFADLLDFTAEEFHEIFFVATGKRLPDASDLSDPETWRRSERPGAQDRRPERPGAGSNQRGSARTQALSVLGLEEGASQSDIKAAYRRLAAVHHPDRFTSLGAEAERAATVTFQRIKAAFDTLAAS